jgi:hypothetical protein
MNTYYYIVCGDSIEPHLFLHKDERFESFDIRSFQTTKKVMADDYIFVEHEGNLIIDIHLQEPLHDLLDHQHCYSTTVKNNISDCY